MSSNHSLVIQPLENHHDRSSFSCGTASLDNYLRKQARQDIRRRISRVFVATNEEQPGAILGCYTLSSLSLDLSQLPESLARKLPRHPLPAALIGRLAVDQQIHGQGIDKMLLMDAITRALSVSENIAIYAIVVDAIDESAEGFYKQYGFAYLSSESRRLFLPLKSWSKG